MWVPPIERWICKKKKINLENKISHPSKIKHRKVACTSAPRNSDNLFRLGKKKIHRISSKQNLKKQIHIKVLKLPWFGGQDQTWTTHNIYNKQAFAAQVRQFKTPATPFPIQSFSQKQKPNNLQKGLESN